MEKCGGLALSIKKISTPLSGGKLFQLGGLLPHLREEQQTSGYLVAEGSHALLRSTQETAGNQGGNERRQCLPMIGPRKLV